MDNHPNLMASSSALDRNAVLEQLERLFAHSAFKNSRRSRAMLRYVVEHYGDSADGHLKERTLGVEVFGREAAYDTNADPVVRAVAGEVRKRIAQYYHEPGHEHEIRIDLPLGSYCPEFHRPSGSDLHVAVGEDSHDATRSEPAEAPPDLHSAASAAHGLRWRALSIPALCLAVLIGYMGWRQLARIDSPGLHAHAGSAMDKFWRPILNSTVPVQIGVGPWPAISNLPSRQVQTLFPYLSRGRKQPIGWWDFTVASQIIGFLQQNGHSIRIQDESVTDLNGLSQNPTVLIGDTNGWVVKLTQGLRFHIVQADGHEWIADRKFPAKQYRPSSGAMPGSQTQYAIVARLADPTTGQYIVVLAGVGSPATVFAGRVATLPRCMQALADRLPAGWENKNVEALVSGQAVNGQPGAPHIVATDVW